MQRTGENVTMRGLTLRDRLRLHRHPVISKNMKFVSVIFVISIMLNFALNAQILLFDGINFDRKMLKEWEDSDFDHEAFCRLPSNLSDSEEFMNQVDQVRIIARRSNYINLIAVKDEIDRAIKINQFTPIFGWGTSMINCPQDIEFCYILAGFVSEKNSEELNFLLLKTIDGIAGEYPDIAILSVKTVSAAAKNKKISELKTLVTKLKNLKDQKVIVKVAMLKKECYLEYLIKQIELIVPDARR